MLRIARAQVFTLLSLLFISLGTEYCAFAQEREGDGIIQVKTYSYAETNSTRCIIVAFLVFDDEEDVTWNKISYYDALYAQTVETTILPPFEDDFFLSGIPDGQFDVAEGQHQVSLSLSSVGEDEFSAGRCADAEAELMDRFSEPQVFFDRDLNKISGSVTQWYCSAHGIEVFESQRRFPEFGRLVDDPGPSCEKRGVTGERIILKRAGSGRPRRYRTRVNADGTFEALVKDGTYRVGVSPRRRRQFFPTRPLPVQVRGEDVADIDFEYRSNKRLKLKVKDMNSGSGYHITPDFRFITSNGSLQICNRSQSSDHDHVYEANGSGMIPTIARGQCERIFGPLFVEDPVLITATCNLHPDEYGIAFIVPDQN